MLSIPLLLKRALGAGLLAAGLAVFWRGCTREERGLLPTRVECIDMLGPLRAVPIPFLWSEVGRATDKQDRRARRAPARLLSWFLPERPDFLYDLAWRRAYDDASAEADPRRQVEALIDALEILDEAATRPDADGLARAWQGFHLVTRCGDQEGGEARRRAFAEMTGSDPLDLASRLLEEAKRRAPDVNWVLWQRATALEFLATTALETALPDLAATRLEEAATAWASTGGAERSSFLTRLARALRDRGEPAAAGLGPEDRNTLTGDFVFGRAARLWLEWTKTKGG